MKMTCLFLIIFTTISCTSGQQQEARYLDKPIIKSEKLIYYTVKTSKKERKYGFGQDMFREFNADGGLLKESLILVEQDSRKETTNLAYQNYYENGNVIKADVHSV